MKRRQNVTQIHVLARVMKAGVVNTATVGLQAKQLSSPHSKEEIQICICDVKDLSTLLHLFYETSRSTCLCIWLFKVMELWEPNLIYQFARTWVTFDVCMPVTLRCFLSQDTMRHFMLSEQTSAPLHLDNQSLPLAYMYMPSLCSIIDLYVHTEDRLSHCETYSELLENSLGFIGMFFPSNTAFHVSVIACTCKLIILISNTKQSYLVHFAQNKGRLKLVEIPAVYFTGNAIAWRSLYALTRCTYLVLATPVVQFISNFHFGQTRANVHVYLITMDPIKKDTESVSVKTSLETMTR